MPEQPRQLCEVANCARAAAGSYLHLGGATSTQFAVCDVHLAQLKAGVRPSVVADQADQADHDARPLLLLAPAVPAGRSSARSRIDGSD